MNGICHLRVFDYVSVSYYATGPARESENYPRRPQMEINKSVHLSLPYDHCLVTQHPYMQWKQQQLDQILKPLRLGEGVCCFQQCIHNYIYISIHTYIYIHIHIYTYTYTVYMVYAYYMCVFVMYSCVCNLECMYSQHDSYDIWCVMKYTFMNTQTHTHTHAHACTNAL